MTKRLACEANIGLGEKLRLRQNCEEVADLSKSIECFQGVPSMQHAFCSKQEVAWVSLRWQQFDMQSSL